MVLDSQRDDVRAMFAEVLSKRADIAESRRHPEEFEELVARLRLHDPYGHLYASLVAPGRLTVTSVPEARSARLVRYHRDDEGRLVEQPIDMSQPLSWRDVEIRPGSYLLTVDAPGRAQTRYPFVVGRGESVGVDLALPMARSVLDGFVWIPEGTSMFGSEASDDLRRDFFGAVPLHRVRSDPFLIAMYETTFGQWIEYLDELPPQERASRTPRSSRHEPLLERGDDGRWRLRIQPTTLQLTAAQGDPLRYPGRGTNSTLDWSKIPVVGVTAGDAEAYAAWLDSTGRASGARLCTEQEWERAARGGDDRPYPHGYRLDPEDANFDATYGQQTEAMGPDEVGAHPRSQSPFGVYDMAGNVWEWTRSSLRDRRHVARGGSFYYDATSARIGNREVPEPEYRDVNVGFRLCADPTARTNGVAR